MPSSAPLTASRWAPSHIRSRRTVTTTCVRDTATTDAPTDIQPTSATGFTPADTLTRIARLLTRLEWKAQLLLLSREGFPRVTTSAPTPQHDDNNDNNENDVDVDDALREQQQQQQKHAQETMFRLDFYEFYALLERCLVLLLEACGVCVRSGREEIARAVTAAGGGPAVGYARATHRFHANVLEALERHGCPLRAALGEGEVRVSLGRAKEFRNRWKDVEDEDFGRFGGDGLGREALRGMVEGIVRGLREGEGVVRSVLEGRGVKALVSARENGLEYDGQGMKKESLGKAETPSDDDSEMGDAPWEAVEDAMDWDWDVS